MNIEWHTDGFEKIIKAVFPETEVIETVRIPSELDGKPVSRLGHNLFVGNEFIKTVIIPASVRIIGVAAFEDCKNLKTVIFEEGSELEVIDEYAFNSCDIRDFPFQDLKKLQKIGCCAFSENRNLEIVDLSNSDIMSLPLKCFANTGITEIYFPKNFSNFGGYCLGNTQLKKLDLSNIEHFLSLGYESFKNNLDLEEVIFPEGPVSLGRESFAGCPLLKEISIPANVTLAEYCFKFCGGLEKVIFEKGSSHTKLLPEGAFQECLMLKTVQIDTDFTVIGKMAFYKCTALQEISFPKTLTKIDEAAFYRCKRIQSVDLTETNMQKIESQSFAYTTFDFGGFKMDYTSGAEIVSDAFEDNPNIYMHYLTARYPFCYIHA